MINRDNLRHESSIRCVVMSIAENQWTAFLEAKVRVQNKFPGLTFDYSTSGWGYHNGGYYYREVGIAHRWPGRAFEAADMIEAATKHIPLKEARNE